MLKRYVVRGRPWLMVCVMSVLEGCALPGPEHDVESLDTVSRFSYDANITGNDITLSALRSGPVSNPRLIFVHGTPGDAQGWADELAEPLTGPDGPFEIIAPDRPGFGESDLHAVSSLADQAAALEPLLVARKGQWPILIGHSLGGPIVAKAAAMYPDKVGAIVIVSGALDPAQEHVLFIQRVGNFPLVRWLLPRWARNSNCELIPLKGELETLSNELPDIRCPIVIVHGRKDQLVPFANVAYMQAAFAGNDHVSILTLDDANHFIPWTHKPIMDRAILQAIDMLKQSAQSSSLMDGHQSPDQALDHRAYQSVAAPQNGSSPS